MSMSFLLVKEGEVPSVSASSTNSSFRHSRCVGQLLYHVSPRRRLFCRGLTTSNFFASVGAISHPHQLCFDHNSLLCCIEKIYQVYGSLYQVDHMAKIYIINFYQSRVKSRVKASIWANHYVCERQTDRHINMGVLPPWSRRCESLMHKVHATVEDMRLS